MHTIKTWVADCWGGVDSDDFLRIDNEINDWVGPHKITDVTTQILTSPTEPPIMANLSIKYTIIRTVIVEVDR